MHIHFRKRAVPAVGGREERTRRDLEDEQVEGRERGIHPPDSSGPTLASYSGVRIQPSADQKAGLPSQRKGV